eukprot:COSAG01_NODE_8846_length_2638_cov_6.417487_4_plen_237_part_00
MQVPGAERDARAPQQGQNEATLELAAAEEEEEGASSGGEGEWNEQGAGDEDAEELFGDEEDWTGDEEEWTGDEEEWTEEEELSGDEEDWSDAGQDWSGADDEEASGDESGLTSEDEEAFMLDAEREWAAKEIQRHARGRMLRQLMRQAQAEVEASLAVDPQYEAWPPVAAADWRYPVVQLHQRGILLASQGASTEACDVLEEALELLIKSVPAGMAMDAGLEAELQDQVPRPPPTA